MSTRKEMHKKNKLLFLLSNYYVSNVQQKREREKKKKAKIENEEKKAKGRKKICGFVMQRQTNTDKHRQTQPTKQSS